MRTGAVGSEPLIEVPEEVWEHRSLRTFDLLDVPIAALHMQDAIDLVSSWICGAGRPKLVTFSNVHMLVEAHRSLKFKNILRAMDLNCPDGMPLSVAGRLDGQSISRVSGPDFMEQFCEATAHKNYRHFFYGGGPGIAQKTAAMLSQRYPHLQVAGSYTPPFRPLTPEEDEQIVEQIHSSGADIVWVCLGCPKQEIWLHDHQDKLNVSVMLAVGQAFELSAGVRKRAPRLLRSLGMEWFYRLLCEPRRLFRRYFTTNTQYLYLLTRDYFRRMLRARSV